MSAFFPHKWTLYLAVVTMQIWEKNEC